MTREIVQHVRAGVVSPLDVVHHENKRTTTPQCLDELVHGTGQTRLPRFGKIVRQLWQVRKAFADIGYQGDELGERHRSQAA